MLTTELLGAVLKVGDVGLAALVGDGVVAAPLGGDPAEVAARVLSLGVVAHGGSGCGWWSDWEFGGLVDNDEGVVGGGGGSSVELVRMGNGGYTDVMLHP